MSRRRFRVSWRENVAFALVAMRTQKLRTFLTLLGVMAGVATVIMMVSFVVGFNNAVTAGFTSFGAHLVQFQKFEPRFGPNEPPEEERNRRDLTIEDARALKRLSTLAAAVSPERYIFGTATVKAGKEEANGPLVVGVAPDYSMANTHFVQDGRFITDADVTHAAPVCRDRHRRRGGALPASRSHRPGAHSERPRLPGGRPVRAQGVLLRRQQRQLRGHPHLHLRRPVPGGQERRRRHHPHRDRAAAAGGRARPDRGGDGDPARPARPAPGPGERLRDVHERGHAAELPADHGGRGRGHDRDRGHRPARGRGRA